MLRDSERIRVKYDLDPELKAVIERIAKREDTSASQIAQLLLGWAVQMYAKDNQKLLASISNCKLRSRTPRFGWNLRLPRRWTAFFSQFIPTEIK